jgi:hypothetical protein
MSNTKKRPVKEQLSIHQEMKLSRQKAIEISKNHIDVKPIKFLLK